MSDAQDALVWKLVGGASAAFAAMAARRVVEAAWTTATGHEPPANPEDPETTWGEAVGWALLSGAAIGMARLLAARGAAQYWSRRTGSLPPGIRSVR